MTYDFLIKFSFHETKFSIYRNIMHVSENGKYIS